MPADVEDVLFIVLASPVEEIGRDHDFDWGVVEPSSLHAIIQLVGRINRHRLLEVMQPNVFLLDVNVRYLKEQPICFTRPGLQQHVPNDEAIAATHLIPHARHLMQAVRLDAPLTEAFALDASLVFDPTRRCHFAEEDERAIEALLKNAEVFFQPDHEQWACDWFYLRYPLREAEAREAWRVTPTVNGELELKKHNRTRTKSREWLTECTTAHEKRPADETTLWLSPDLYAADQAMRERLAQMFGADDALDLMEQARQFTVQGKTALPQLYWSGVRTN